MIALLDMTVSAPFQLVCIVITLEQRHMLLKITQKFEEQTP